MFFTEDQELAKAVQKLRDGYANQLKHRKCTIFLDMKDVHSKEDVAMTPKDRQIHNDKLEAKENAKKEKENLKQEKALLKQKVKQEKADAKTVSKAEIIYCHATKMDGKKCTAKAKNSCNFCGRHTPKM